MPTPYRYRLRRDLGGGGAGTLLWVLANPSRADDHRDDPTVRRCVAFTRTWGYAALEVVNLFAWRSSDPRELRTVADPVGHGADAAITAAAQACDAVVVGWGAVGRWRGRDAEALDLLRAAGAANVGALGRNRDGTPRHPLYVPATARRRPWPGDDAVLSPSAGRPAARPPAGVPRR